MKKILVLLAALTPALAFSQDELVKKLEKNGSDSSKKKFRFTTLINIENTPVKNQGSSGTCWSYSTNSFLESEALRMGRKPVDIAEIYTARCVYMDKAENYVRMHGSVSWGDGGECHDVISTYAKYGAMPRSAYSGLQYGTTKNQFAEMQAILEGMLQAVVKNKNGKLTPSWRKAFNAVLDAYLGPVPASFEYQGKDYTPTTFAKKMIGIDPEQYVELTSWTNTPVYKKTVLMVPDNWNFQQAYNVKMDDLTGTIDNALRKGYSVAWATDVSERCFSWKNGVAYVPEKEYEDMSEAEQKSMFDGPKPDRQITAAMRQEAFDNYQTTDDHGMHIVGLAKDQSGKEYYIVKNSWGDKNDYKGYLYVSKPYVQYKTTAILLHRDALPSAVSNKLF